MIPKVESCLLALEHGVSHVHIIDGRKPHALFLRNIYKQRYWDDDCSGLIFNFLKFSFKEI